MVVIIGAMALVEETRPQLIPSFLSLGVVLLAYLVRSRRAERSGPVPARAG